MTDNDLRNRVAWAIQAVEIPEGRWTEDRVGVWLVALDEAGKAADAALAEMGEPTPVNVRKGPDWEGFGRDLLQDWPVGDVDGADLFDAALRNGLLREIPGGYDPEKHIDTEGICPEEGDPWYEYAFGAAIKPATVSEQEAARVLLIL